MKRTHYAGRLDASHLGREVRVAGWVEDVRPLGALLFLTIRDVSGFAQVVFDKRQVDSDVFKAAKAVPRQSAVLVEGVVSESKARGLAVEVKAKRLEVMNEAVHPLPLDPTGRVRASLDVTFDARALKLRDPKAAAVVKIKQEALQSIRRTLVEEGCIEVTTAKIIGQAAEGGANLFNLDYFGRKGYLAQSPQLYKEQLTLSLDSVFEIGTYFRAEKSHTRRHLNEFVSVDMEAAFCDEEDVMRILERLLSRVMDDVLERGGKELQVLGHTLPRPRLPIERLTYEQAVEELKGLGMTLGAREDLTDHALTRLGKLHKGFYFIVDWPIALKPFYIEEKEGGWSRSFDLMHGSLELASGGMRISKRRKLEERLTRAGLDPSTFRGHLEVFDWGMPPHSGWGLGLDRLMMILTGKSNIREVVLYPRDRFRLIP